MGRLTVLVTSPRLPAGLLTAAAWRMTDAAELVASVDDQAPLALALSASGIDVQAMPEASAADLMRLATDRVVVWLDDPDESTIATALATAVVERVEDGGGPAPEVEVVIASFDPIGARLLDAVTVMERLREDCPWDRQQTHASLVPYLIEEAYEVVEAVESSDPGDLREELGDLFFQVLFHAQIATEESDSAYSIDDVAAGLVEKLVRRHPHVFSDTEVSGADEVAANWETIKQAEKGRRSITDGIPAGLPALSRASKVVERAIRADARLSFPLPEGETAYTEETLGEVLFALAAAAAAAGLDPERALRNRVRAEIDSLRAAEQRAVPTDEEQPG